MLALKFLPHLFCWFGTTLLLFRAFRSNRSAVAISAFAGLSSGVALAYLLRTFFRGDTPFIIIKDSIGFTLVLLWVVSVVAIYRSTGRSLNQHNSSDAKEPKQNRLLSISFTFITATMSGAIAESATPTADTALFWLIIFIVTATFLMGVAAVIELICLRSFSIPFVSATSVTVAFLLLSSSCVLRLDLFAPLTMKVMKFGHDFVHQFFESILIPDHLFIRPEIWGYVGLLFGNGVGFWGGLIIWFTPVVLILLAVRLERLPSVSHIRQGAERRKLLALAIRARRLRLLMPCFALLILASAVYRSYYPNVEYWDPKPLPVTATPAGEIFIPAKGEIDIKDGKLHKYIFKKDGAEVRFFVLMSPNGKLTVDLDACAICKPEGYGQAEGAVICYYCKTLIPLETVGKPGGCNPVPMEFKESADGVHIDSVGLLNSWTSTVQATTRVNEGGK